MRKRKAWSILLSGAMVLGTLAGTAVTAAAEEKPTYKIATVRWTDTWPTDYLYEGIMQQIADKVGINIEWQVYYNADWTEQKSLLLASGDLPDAFFGSICLNATDVSQNKAYFLDLTDLIEPNMPNLMAAMETAPELRAIATDRDGRIYSLPKKLPLRPQLCGNCLYINQTWLDNLGLEMPKTLDELTEVLKKFATEDADGDGDATNEIGYTNSAGQTLLSGDLRNILFPFGTMVSRADNYMGLNGEGTPVFMPMEENYRDAVVWMHDLYESGVLDPEYFTQESSMATAKRQAEGGSQVGMITGWTADAEAGLNGSQFTPLESVEGPDGNHYVENASNFLDISDRELLITTKCENPEKLLQWADEFYTDIVSLQTFYGSIPDQVSENEDGTYDVLVPEDGSSLDTSAWSHSMRDFGPKYMTDAFAEKVTLPADQGDGIKLAEDAINGKYVTEDKNVGLPMLQYTEEELSRINQIGTDIYKYCEANYAHWVVDGGVEDEWDGYIEQLKQMGVEELVSIHQGAYDAYVANME